MLNFFPFLFVFFWSSAFISGQIIVQSASPFASLSFRFMIVALGFVIFAKIFNEMGVDINDVLIVTVDRDKISPNREQEGKDIRYVPTLIVSKDNQEIGRIVESPSSETATLESDLFEISLGIPPVPNYSDTK